METRKEILANAELAFANQQYEEALGWYQKALADTSDDLYVLSRAGAICVPLGKFEDALRYFGRAKDLAPDNGDNYFNYANACFFNHDYAAAFAMYVEAERKGCSEDVTPRLYYQLAMLCSVRQDLKSALAYFKKSEDADKKGLLSLSPDLISEKLKLYMLAQDYGNAEKCAAQLVAIQPLVFKNYMVYFSLLMAQQSYTAAEKVLNDAKLYADLTDEDRFTLTTQMVSLLTAKGIAQGEEQYAKAIELLEETYKSASLTEEQKQQVLLMLSDAYLKVEKYEDAINLLHSMLSPEGGIDLPAQEPAEETPEDVDAMLEADLALVQEKIDCGEMDDSIIDNATIEYDEEGNERRVYDAADVVLPEPAEEAEETPVLAAELPLAVKERAYFTLLSAYIGKDDFAGAVTYANILRRSENKHYAYYGLYTAALSEKKLNGNTPAVERQYAEAIAFFRNKMFADTKDTLAAVFRARLYVEQGKMEKAKEIAQLLSDADRQSILSYIQQNQG